MPDLTAPGSLMTLLDISFDETTPTRVVGSVAADDRHHQPWGLVHGGLYTAAIETFATTGAYEAVKDRGQLAVGVTNITDFLRPHRQGRLAVTATAIHQGRRQQLWSAAADELITARLRLRRWRPEDESAMTAINRDPEVMRYLNRPTGAAATRAFLPLVSAHWEEHGFGFWAIESLEPDLAGPCLGFVGVAYPKFLPELGNRPEIGWRLASRAWGRGLATEGALAARDDAFATLGVPELISIIHPENARSQRVAQKLGLTPSARMHNPHMDRDVEVWQIDA